MQQGRSTDKSDSYLRRNTDTYTKRLQPKRTDCDGKSFDSQAEAKFYRLLRGLLPEEYSIEHPYKISTPGKKRDWRLDFGIFLCNRLGEPIYCEKLEKLKALLKQTEVKPREEGESSILLIEFKGAIDIQEPGTEKSGKLARVDTNFVSRINHFSLYAPYILEDLVCVGVGSSGIVTYCRNLSYCVSPVINTDFFRQVVKSVF